MTYPAHIKYKKYLFMFWNYFKLSYSNVILVWTILLFDVLKNNHYKHSLTGKRLGVCLESGQRQFLGNPGLQR